MTLHDATRQLSALVMLAAAGTASVASAQVPLQAALALKPRQPDVFYDRPTAAEATQCKIESRSFPQGDGYIVTGPTGQTLRELLDTSKDGKLNEFRYFGLGLETYREIDTDGDGRFDEYRFLNTAGTRWGVDSDRDGKIDRWKRLSAEEATREAVAALAAGDAKRLATVVITKDDVRQLGLTGEVAAAFLKRAADVPGQMKTALAAGSIDKTTRWERFDSAMLMPVLVPAESGKSDRDVVVYENVTAVARTGGNDVFLNVGEVVQVGNVWKLSSVPQPFDATKQVVTEGGLLLQPTFGTPTGPADGLTAGMQKIFTQLQELDKDRPGADASQKQIEGYNVARVKLLRSMVEAAPTAEAKSTWWQQMIDTLSAASLLRGYPDPVTAMQSLEKEVPKEFRPYVVFRRLQVESSDRMQKASGEQEAVAQTQEWFRTELEKFIRAYPSSQDAPEAMWALATAFESLGEIKKARDWYEAASKNFGKTMFGRRSAGAINRLGLVGQPLEVSGTTIAGQSLDLAQYRGKVVAVVFWSTWSDLPSRLPALKKLRDEYGRNGFEVVGVFIDNPNAPAAAYVKEQNVFFPTIDANVGSQRKDLDSEIASRFGFINLPTVMLVDKRGVVVDNAASISELEKQIPKLLLR